MLFSRSRLLAAVLFAVFAGGVSRGERPLWWLESLNQNPSADSAVATQGQAMHMAKIARNRIASEFPNAAAAPGAPVPPAEAAITALFNGYSTAGNSKPLRIGQLKYISSLFWDRMAEIGVAGFPRAVSRPYPWTQDTSDDADNALATLGQVKMAFSMEIYGGMRDSDHDLLPESWELGHASSLTAFSGLSGADFEQDGLTDAQEYALGTDPDGSDTDFDGISDGLENNIGTDPKANSVGVDTDGDGITDTAEGLIRYLALQHMGPNYGPWPPGNMVDLTAVDPLSNLDVLNDGLPDDFQKIWRQGEPAAGGGLSVAVEFSADGDTDGDGLSNRDEALHRTWPAPLFSQLSAEERAAMLRDLNGDGVPELLQPEYDFAPTGYNDNGVLTPDPAQPGTTIPERLERAKDFDLDGFPDGAEVAAGRNPRVFDGNRAPDIITPVGGPGDPPDVQWRSGGAMNAQWANGQWSRTLDPYGTTPENAFLDRDPAGTEVRFIKDTTFHYRNRALTAVAEHKGTPGIQIFRRSITRSYSAGQTPSKEQKDFMEGREGTGGEGKWEEITGDLTGSWKDSRIPSPFPGSHRLIFAEAVDGKDNSNYFTDQGQVRITGSFIPNLSFLISNATDTGEYPYQISETQWVPSDERRRSFWKSSFSRFDSQGSSEFAIGPVMMGLSGFSVGKFIPNKDYNPLLNSSQSPGKYLQGQRSYSDGNAWPCLLYIGLDEGASSKITRAQLVSNQLNGVYVDATPGSSRIVTLRCHFYPTPSDEPEPYVKGISFQTTGNIDLLDLGNQPLKKSGWITPVENGIYRFKARLNSTRGSITYKLKMRAKRLNTIHDGEDPLNPDVTQSEVDENIDGTTVRLTAYGGEATIPQLGQGMGVQITEDAGNRFRKVGINGVPLADSKPQNEAESDQSYGEMHIDALTHSLYHHTSDLYVPVAASDLSLSAERTLRQEIINDASQGNSPNLLSGNGTGYIGKPFGVCWSSGITPYVELSLGVNSGGGGAPDRATVVDETGASYSFALGSVATSPTTRLPLFIPLASGPDQTAFMNRLEISDGATGPTDYSNWKLTLCKRFGTQTRYEHLGTLVDAALENGKPQISRTRHFYRPVNQVTISGQVTASTDPGRWAVSDRYQNRLYYHYNPVGSDSSVAIAIQKALIPLSISDFSNQNLPEARCLRITRTGAQNPLAVPLKGLPASLKINNVKAEDVRFKDAFIGRIDIIGNSTVRQTVLFDYAAKKFADDPDTRFPADFYTIQLGRVRRPVAAVGAVPASIISTYYDYADAQEPDSGPLTQDGPPAVHRHLWLSRIVGSDGRYLKFTTGFDRSRVRYCPDPTRVDAVSMYYEQGKPRPVRGVDAGQHTGAFSSGTLESYLSPQAAISENEVALSRFALQSDGVKALDPLVLDNAPSTANPAGKLKVANPPVNAVVDGDRRLRLYRFRDPDIREGTDLAQVLFPPPPGLKRDTIVNLAWKTLEIDHGLGAKEIYTFKPEAMMALTGATMITPGQGVGPGHSADTVWTYDKTFSIAHAIPVLKDATFTGSGLKVSDHAFFPKFYPDPSSETRIVRGGGGSLTGLSQEVLNNTPIVKTFTYWADTAPGDPTHSQFRKPWARTMLASVTTGSGLSLSHEVTLDQYGRPAVVTDKDLIQNRVLRTVTNTYKNGTPRPLLEQESIADALADGVDLVTAYSNADFYGQYQTVRKGSGPFVETNTVRNELGQTTTQYNGNSNTRAVTFTYRSDGRLAMETKPILGTAPSAFPDGNTKAVTYHTYDSAGRKETVKSPDGTITKYGYDVLGRVISTEVTPDPTAYPYIMATPKSVTGTRHTVTGLPVESVSASEVVIRTTYDWLRRPTLVITHDPSSNSLSGGGDTAVSMEYTGSWCGDSLFDASSFKPTLIRGPFISSNGPARTEASYNSLGWKISERVQYREDGSMAETRTAHNALGQVIGVETPGGNDNSRLLTKTPRDVLGRIMQTIRPDGGITTPVYQMSSGLVTRVEEFVPGVSGSGFPAQTRVTKMVYDAAGREIAVYPPSPAGPPSGTPSRITQYDSEGVGLVFRTAVPALQAAASTVPDHWLITETTYDNRSRPYKTIRGIKKTTGTVLTPEADITPALFSTAGVYSLKEYTAPATGQTSGTTVDTDWLTSYTWYDIMDRPTRTLAPDGAEAITVYDHAGRSLRSAGPRTSTLGPSGLIDPGDGTLSVQVIEGNTCTATAYDAAGRAIVVRSGILLTPARTGQDLWTAVTGSATDPLGDENGPVNNTVRNSYDGNGRLLATTRTLAPDAQPVIESFQYDGSGNRISVTDARGSTTLFTYDPLGRVLATIIQAPDNVPDKFDITRNTWGATSLRGTKTPDGRTKTFTYDNGLRVRVINGGQEAPYTGPSELQPVEPEQIFVHNAAGELLSTSVAGQAWRGTACAYDARGRKISETSAGRTQAYAYNELNQLVSVTTDLAGPEEDGDPSDDLRVTTTYDLLGRVSGISENRSSGTTVYGYDRGGHTILKQLPGGVISEWKTYDLSGRLLTQRTLAGTAGIPPQLTSCVHDAAGNLVFQSESRPASGTLASMSRYVWNTYDSLNRLVDETIYSSPAPVAEGHATPSETSEYTYDRANNRTRFSRTLADGSMVTETSEFSTGENDDYLTDPDLEFDPFWDSLGLSRGNIPALLAPDPREPAHPRTDQIRRTLITRQAPNAQAPEVTGAVVYRYDRNGNRSHRVEFVMDPASGGQSRISKKTVYVWDQSNRLISVQVTPHTANGTPSGAATGGYQTWTYSYDHRSRRILRIGGDVSTTVEVDSFAGGTALTRWTFGSTGLPHWTTSAMPSFAFRNTYFIRGSDFGGGVGGLLYSVDSSPSSSGTATNFLQYGARGDVTDFANITGKPVFRSTYRAFGEHSDQGSAVPSVRQRASTKEEESALGLLNEGFRWRDIRTGTFLSRDPAGFVDGPNLYSYVRQNPWSAFDPEGLADERLVDVGSSGSRRYLEMTEKLPMITGYAMGGSRFPALLGSDATQEKLQEYFDQSALLWAGNIADSQRRNGLPSAWIDTYNSAEGDGKDKVRAAIADRFAMVAMTRAGFVTNSKMKASFDGADLTGRLAMMHLPADIEAYTSGSSIGVGKGQHIGEVESVAPSGRSTHIAAARAAGGYLHSRPMIVDENLSPALVDALKTKGFNAVRMSNGMLDPDIIAWAKNHNASVLTGNTRDFVKQGVTVLDVPVELRGVKSVNGLAEKIRQMNAGQVSGYNPPTSSSVFKVGTD
ncbi:MAG: DUF5615 family PIN-like protein [Verrucomicrobiota bacterium]